MDEKTIRILSLEDDDVDHQFLMRMVKERALPYLIDRGSTIAAALELIGKNRYDVVLLDYLTPDGTGLDLLEKIIGIPSVFITGSGNETVAVMAMKGGACDYLIKDPEGMYLELLPSVIEKTMHNFQMEEDKKRAEVELRVRLDEEQRLNNLLLQRELRIKELRDRVDELEIKLGERGS